MAEHQNKLGITQVMTEEAFVPKRYVRQPYVPPPRRQVERRPPPPPRVQNNLNDVVMPGWVLDPEDEEGRRDEYNDNVVPEPEEIEEGLPLFDLFAESDDED